MILASHQPDLFPYTGFWHKMAKADLFDVAIYDQYQRNGYQRRVKMGGRWVGHRIWGDYFLKPINEIAITDESIDGIIDGIKAAYSGARFWKMRSPIILDIIDEARALMLWEFNMAVIVGIRDYLDITTPLSIGSQPTEHGTAGILELIDRYGADLYLSGSGGHAYIESEDPRIVYSDHVSWTEDSILQTIFCTADPMAWVLR